ncbi:F-box domain-containing protein [Favolaschia claudopus]|uniref:F-box domain-containing protein n=1 Tax=Favolaschia claudopus TaxID=2862362 RepID=A0AAW0A9K9_9AGAR
MLSREKVNAQMAVTEAKIRKLEDELVTERRTLGHLRLLFIFGKLPTELMVEIFMLAISSTPAWPRVLKHILSLSQVCALWREIVVGSPKIWAQSVVEVCLDYKQRSVSSKDYLETIFHRSAPHSISVSFICGNKDAPTVHPKINTDAIARAISNSAPRWKSLTVGGNYPGWATVDAPLLNLQTLKITAGSLPPTLPSCPNLRRLTIADTGVNGSSTVDLTPIPLANLTHIDLESFDLASLLSILRQCEKVVTASLATKLYTWSQVDVNMLYDGPVTVLSSLTHLKLKFSRGEPQWKLIGPFFAPLALPSLRTLRLSFNRSAGIPWPVEAFTTFQMRAPQLSDLCLSGTWITAAQLIGVLRLAPALTSLSLICCPECVKDAFFLALTEGPTSARQLVPQLTFLYLRDVRSEFGNDKLDAAIRSRGWSEECQALNRNRLQQVRILDCFSKTRITVLEAKLTDLIWQGFKLVFV